MFSLRRSSAMLLAVVATLAFHSFAQAADPGLPLPSDGVMNDQKPGSVVVFNLFTSSATGGNIQNARISITNTNPDSSAFIRFYLASDRLGADALAVEFLRLAGNQTATFLTSDLLSSAGITGFIIAVAVDELSGCPTGFNFLVGNLDVKFAAGFQASLSAQTIAANFTGAMPGCQAETGSATLLFNGESNGYDRLPRTLAIDRVSSPADGNDSLLVINRFGGSLSRFTDRIGLLVGTLYNDAGNAFEFTRDIPLRHFRTNLLSLYGTSLNSVIPAGRKGWMKFSTTQSNDFALFGAILNFNPGAEQNSRSAFNGGENLRALTFTSGVTLTISIRRPPSNR